MGDQAGDEHRLWDPLGAWPGGGRWIWAVLAVGIICLHGPDFVGSLRPPREKAVDFFQEWSSARNFVHGMPIYADYRKTVEHYLGWKMSAETCLGNLNAHPPTAVLIAIPMAALDYPDAVLAWNLLSLAALGASLWMVVRGLEIPFSAWSLFPTVALLLLCGPLRQQVLHGQLNLALLLLVTGTWMAERSGRPRLAGVLLGAAAAIKLFPGFFFVYYLLRRQWTILVVGVLTLAVLTGVTAAVLGPETYRVYVREAIPENQWFRVAWNNASLMGFWAKLFDPVIEKVRTCHRIEPLWPSPTLARVGTMISSAVVVVLLARAVWRARSRSELDQTFGLAVTAMLLVSPITWDHYLLLLLVPLAKVWVDLPPSSAMRIAFLLIVFALWPNPLQVTHAFIPGGYRLGVARPVHTLTVLSFQCYALLGLFALGLMEARRARANFDPPRVL